MGDRAPLPQLADFPLLATEKTRFGDTDAFGHINNAVVSTFLESGRGELLRYGGVKIDGEGCRFVVARVEIDFRDELTFPGDVVIGTRIARIGRSSLTCDQAVFQHGVCRVTAVSTLVHVNAGLKASSELTLEARAHFARLGQLST